MENYVMLTANAGLMLCINGKKILIDALHAEQSPGYSCVPADMQQQIIHGEGDFDSIDYFIITHNHPDHVSPVLACNFARMHPETIIFAPMHIQNCEEMNILSSASESFSFGSDTLYFRHTIHAGVEYRNVLNYSGIIDIDGTKISFLGDAGLERNLATGEFARGVDIGIFNFPFFSLNHGRDIIKMFHPEKIIVCHLPFIEDDINGYLSVTERVYEKKYLQFPKTYIMKKAGQKEIL